MQEVYKHQHHHWLPNYSLLEPTPYSADLLCKLLWHLVEDERDETEDGKYVHNVFVASLLANGWIEFIMQKSYEDDVDDEQY